MSYPVAASLPARRLVPALLLPALLLPTLCHGAEPELVLDLAAAGHDDGVVTRVYGSSGDGSLGLPVAAGTDVDGDGFPDFAFGSFQSDPGGVENAGQVDLIFGDGTVGGFLDTAQFSPRMLRFIGGGEQETAGSEVWIDDVTGDGLGDLLICRQNYTPEPGRIGAGALTLVVGSPDLRERAATDAPVDLGSPPERVILTTLIGGQSLGRFCMWVRTGDVDGDGILDLVIGADQETDGSQPHRGAAYVVRGGPHLASAGTVDLVDFGAGALDGHIARLDPPTAAFEFHFGATTLIADLDGNGRGEVLSAATLARGGAFLPPAGAPPGSTHSFGGPTDGRLYIFWDDTFPAPPWPVGFTVGFDNPTGSRTDIRGDFTNVRFGEELLGGLDYDADGKADLFVGDIAGDGSGLALARTGDSGIAPPKNGTSSGLGHVFYDSAALKNRSIDMRNPPEDLRITNIFGPLPGALGGDTAAHGDFNADGIADLVFTAPHDNPAGRTSAGSIFLFYGREGGWPALLDTAAGRFPEPEETRVVEIRGALGTQDADKGDTLGYSAAAADLDGDGRTDLVTNEMVGNGLAPDTVDVGNLIVVAGAALGGAGEPPATCEPSDTVLCLQGRRFRAEVSWRDFNDNTGAAEVVPTDGSTPEDSGLLTFFDSENWEMLVKVLDGCSTNNRVWVFAAAVTNVEYTLTVTDTVTGAEKEYFNPLGTSADATTDTDAFDACP